MVVVRGAGAADVKPSRIEWLSRNASAEGSCVGERRVRLPPDFRRTEDRHNAGLWVSLIGHRLVLETILRSYLAEPRRGASVQPRVQQLHVGVLSDPLDVRLIGLERVATEIPPNARAALGGIRRHEVVYRLVV